MLELKASEVSEYRRMPCPSCQRDTVFELKRPWRGTTDGYVHFVFTCTNQVRNKYGRLEVCGDSQTIKVADSGRLLDESPLWEKLNELTTGSRELDYCLRRK